MTLFHTLMTNSLLFRSKHSEFGSKFTIFRRIVVFIQLISLVSPIQSASESDTIPLKKVKNSEFRIVPYIGYNRTLGLQIGVVPLAMYKISKKDTISPSSISGAAVMYTTNKSWFAFQFNKFFFDEDRYRVVLAYGGGSLNSQMYIDIPINDFIDFNVAAFFAKIELQRRIMPKLYGGVNYSYSRMNTQPNPLALPEANNELAVLQGLGAMLSYDVRNSVYYPECGYYLNLKLQTYPSFMGNDFASNRIVFEANRYVAMMANRDVLALRFFGAAGIGDLSFNQQFVIGNKDIRGYTKGRYRGEQMVAIQGEYRWNPTKKVGLVGFAGAASIFSSENSADNGKLLPGLGAGFRYNVFPNNHMNVGVDAAVGKDDWGVYFKIGEAF